jgi:hypothetical protein
LTLFEAKDDVLRQRLRELNPDAMTPLDALKVLSELKRQADQQT